MMNKRLIATLLLGATLLPTLQGCLPLVATSATVGVLAAVDRRSVGTQTEDESIEWKASARIRDNLGDRAHVNVTSYNRKVLLTGETFTAEAKAEVDRLVRDVPNVQGTYNELVVAPTSSFTARSNDAFITSKIKSRSVDNGKFNPVHVKVVTEAGVAFLLGTVTQAEADAALQVASTTAGVRKVVNLLEIISVARAREIDAAPANAKPGNEPR
ncbi:BON domain-containing protein [uncultured Propionivibrio sp.]|uniref:BON domain-containing protein n=1 Tax=uncultured Propionivibrio sp. TaxID=426737 RepID=UPI0029C095B1|nr:BON domain-containing protein [uncultured Propionivibrio sp.]